MPFRLVLPQSGFTGFSIDALVCWNSDRTADIPNASGRNQGPNFRRADIVLSVNKACDKPGVKTISGAGGVEDPGSSRWKLEISLRSRDQAAGGSEFQNDPCGSLLP